MTTFNPNHVISLEAAVDFTNFRWHFCVVDSDGKAAMATSSILPIAGVVQNNPITGGAVSIMPLGSGGTSKIVLGATLSADDRVTAEYNSAADVGKAIASATGKYNAGQLLVGGVEDNIGEILLASQTVDA